MHHLVSILLAILLLTACGAQHPSPSEIVTGELYSARLLSDYPAFSHEYQQYQPQPSELEAIRALQGKSVLVFFGTWCHDSVREVPRLLKLLDQSGVTVDTLELIAVGLDKKDPEGLAQQFNLLYTPTIIIQDGQQELYRMVERPHGPLAMDLMQGLAAPQ